MLKKCRSPRHKKDLVTRVSTSFDDDFMLDVEIALTHFNAVSHHVLFIIELVVITGCSSGLGRETVKNLLATDQYHVVGAVRDIDKMEAVAEIDNFNMDNFHIMECELNSFASVHKFCDELKEYQMAKPIDRLICNAGGTRHMHYDSSLS